MANAFSMSGYATRCCGKCRGHTNERNERGEKRAERERDREGQGAG